MKLFVNCCKMQILFLGTSSMVPTKDRNQSGISISYKNCGILVDCGEGTQRQLKIAGMKLTKITKILISHLHGDHVLGLPGLIQSMSAAGYEKTLQIYGPVGTKKFMKKLFEVFVFDQKINIDVNEIEKCRFFENEDFVLEARPLKHSIETFGYSLVEKDRRKICPVGNWILYSEFLQLLVCSQCKRLFYFILRIFVVSQFNLFQY